MKYATFAVWKCELPIVKWKRFAQNVAWSKRMFFKHNPSWEKEPKDYYLLRRIEHFLQLKGLNFDVMFIEQVVVVYNTVNEFAASDEKIKYSFYIPIIIDFVPCGETSKSDFLC